MVLKSEEHTTMHDVVPSLETVIDIVSNAISEIPQSMMHNGWGKLSRELQLIQDSVQHVIADIKSDDS